MSKLNKISAHNSDSFKTALGLINTSNGQDNSQTVNTNINNHKVDNGSLAAYTESDKLNLPLINTTNKFKPYGNSTYSTMNHINTPINPLISESRMNELETKLLCLEQTNNYLTDRINTYERNFELQFKRLEQSITDEKDNRNAVHKHINLVNGQSSSSNNELKNKINVIQEIIEKDEKFKFEQRQYDIELYKNLINKLTDKVSETVRMEVDARFKADMDNKILTQNVSQKLYLELDSFRKEMEEQFSVIKVELSENYRENTERVLNLSKYIDTRIEEGINTPQKEIDKLKSFLSKLTDQIKLNMNSQKTQNKIFDDKICNVELQSSRIKSEFSNLIIINEEKLAKNIQDLRLYSDLNIRKNFDNLNTRINELSRNTDNNFEIISMNFINCNDIKNKQISTVINDNKSQFNSIVIDIEAIANRLHLNEELLERFNADYTQTKLKIEEDLSFLQSKSEIANVNERILNKLSTDELKDEIESMRDNLVLISKKLECEMNSIIQENYKIIVDRSKMTLEQINKISQENLNMFKDFEKTFTKMNENIDKIEINNLMNSMLTKIDHEHLNAELFSYKYNKDCTLYNIEEELENVNVRINQNKIESEVSFLMENMLIKLDSNNVKYMNNNSVIEKFLESLFHIEEKLSNLQEENQRLEIEVQNIKNSHSNHTLNETESIDILMEEIINKIEISNLYVLIRDEYLKNIGRFTQLENEIQVTTEKSSNLEQIIDSKIDKLQEKLKKQNMDMWVQAVELTQKINQPEGKIF